MELRQLQTFVTITQTESFSRAAEVLGYTQSALTVQIRLLENELGVKLFDRMGKRVYLTAPGRQFLGHANQIIRDIKCAREFAKSEEEHAYLDDTAAIAAYWRTPTLPLSDWSRFKTVRDVIPTLMPHSRSGATVKYENENGVQLALSRNMDLFSFRTLDFSRFSFRCIPGAVTYRTRWKQHRSPLFAVRIARPADEPFGLLALTIRWTQGQTVI